MRSRKMHSDMTRVRHHVIAAIAGIALACGSPAAHAQSNVPRRETWATDGIVWAVAAGDGVTYIGGDFGHVGPVTGHGVPVDTGTGQPHAAFPDVNGDVRVCVPDGAGGWYIGGRFTRVGGLARNRIAHVLPDGRVNPGWDPDASAEVRTLAVSGSTVYAGGTFTRIGGQMRNRIAALDASTGNATAWNPNAANWVNAIAVSGDGATVYAGGWFTSIGGQARQRIAALDAATGGATAWDPGADNTVETLALSGDGATAYAGGTFTTIGGQARQRIAALDAATGSVTAWDPGADHAVYALALSGDGATVYAGGRFTGIGGQARYRIAALDAATGNATAWDPSADFTVHALAVSVDGSIVYAGGEFDGIGGQARRRVAALDAATGEATAWNPSTAGAGMDHPIVYALAVSTDGAAVFVGGQFTSIGGQVRSRIAALSTATGRATAWNPGADATVRALAVSSDGSTVYAGGLFTGIGGQTRHRIAAFDAATGDVTGWDPSVNSQINAIAVSRDGSTVYTGGSFTSIGGQARQHIAALDAATGQATAWNPGANNIVFALALSADESVVHAGGVFTAIGGEERHRIAALDAATGGATLWDPGANDSVTALVLSPDGATIYAGGYFDTIGGEERYCIAALDPRYDRSLDWNPSARGTSLPNLFALAVSGDGSAVYAGGNFTTIGGEERNRIAALDAATGNATAWNPDVGGSVIALAVSGSTVYAGGSFHHIGGAAHRGFARFDFSGEIRSPVRSGTILAGDTLRFAADGPAGWYTWDFGDGRSSTLKAPGLVGFPAAGEREIVLAFAGGQGQPGLPSDHRTITVAPDPGAVPDLAVVAMHVPEDLAAGHPVVIDYTVRNVGDAALSGAAWTDAIYLSRDAWLDTSDTLLASAGVAHDLAAGASYQGALTITLPAAAREGVYHLILSVDDAWQVLERHQLNNEHAVATDVLIPHLEAGAGRVVAHGQGAFEHFYRIHVPAGGQALRLTLDALESGMTVIVRHGALPTPGMYDYRALDGEIFIPAAAAGDWYVIVVGQGVPRPGEYTLGFETVALYLSSASPARHAAGAPLDLAVTGAGFQAPAVVELTGAGPEVYPASSVEVDSPSRLAAFFPADTPPPGMYGVRVTSNGLVAELPDAVQVAAVGQPRLETSLIVPEAVGLNVPATLHVQYANTGEVSMPAPLFVVASRDPLGTNQPLLSLDHKRVAAGAWSEGIPRGFGHSVQLLAGGENPGLLQPGESRRVPVYYAGVTNPDLSDTRVRFNLGVIHADEQEPVDWDAVQSDMRPSYVREDAWDVVWANFVAQAGTTWGDYVEMLGRDAVYLHRQGLRVQEVTRLLAFALRRADSLSPLPVLAEHTDAAVQAPGLPLVFERAYAQPISRRFELGPLGRGWTHNWQYRLAMRDDGAAAITDMTGTPRIFQPDARPGRSYLAAPGDQGVLLPAAGGGFTLTESDGLVRAFRADGLLDYFEDTHDNRITCEYGGGRLTRLHHSSGQELVLAYNGAGYVASVTDHHGRQTRYTYAGEHLVSVQAHDGRVTAYAYDTAAGAASRHALVEIVLPGGVRRTFAYEAQGRIETAALGAEAERVTFSYGAEGRVTAADALGNVFGFFFDHAGRVVKVEDPLASTVHFQFDELGQLTAVTDPAGLVSTFDYDRRGNLAAAGDVLRRTTRFTYTPELNRLASVTDARVNRTHYHHDSRGNLVAITYPDRSSESWEHDARGHPTAWTNRRGQGVEYAFDAAGRLTRKTTAGGGWADYVYDARGNLVEAVDSSAGAVAFTYDAHDYLARIDYPGARRLEFTYDAAGRRASSLDQTGRRVDYHYDAAGRLERMTDQAAAELVRYAYDGAGRLARKTAGNGVYTDYVYDAAGQLVSLVNRAPDASVISRFDYTYDRRGRRIGMDTHYGSWVYDTDDTGQLTGAVLVSSAGDIPNQDLRYVYDALGNRIRTTINGAEEEYLVNHLNQYTQAGDRFFVHDLDGNLTEETGPDGTVFYTYSGENRLIGVTRGAETWEYTYDALGNLITVTAGGAVTHRVVDPIGLGNVVGAYDAGGNVLARYDHGVGLLNRIGAGGTIDYYTYDALGSASELTGAGGAARNAYVYRPFGETLRRITDVTQPFEFSGEWGVMAGGIGWSHMRARFYDPAAGRFTAVDPIGLNGGDINLYRYGLNNPVLFLDPSGTKGFKCGWQWGGTAVHSFGFSFAYSQGYSLLGAGAFAGSGAGWGFGPGAWSGPSAALGWNLGIASLGVASWGTGGTVQAGVGSFAGQSAGVNLGHSYGQTWGYFCGWSQEPPDTSHYYRPVSYQIWGPAAIAHLRLASDPNEKTGPSGYGERNHVAADGPLAYRVDFENLASATAPAQVVTVSDPLSAHFDWTTFALTEIGFGGELIVVPEERGRYFETVVEWRHGGMDLEVHIEAGIHLSTGEAFATFYTLDPETGWPPPVDFGFLPPEDGTGRGQGHIAYVIHAGPGVPSGTEVRNVATIQFDFGLKIDTNQVDPLDPSQGTDPDKEALVTLSEMGWLQVGIEPEEASGALWSAAGAGAWYPSGAAVQVPTGEHTVVFMELDDWETPANQVATVVKGQTTIVIGTYAPSHTTPPGVPGGFDPPCGAAGVELRPRLNWNDAAGALRYSVYLWPEGTPKPAVPSAAHLAVSEFRPAAALQAGTVYLWQVVAWNPAGETEGPPCAFTTESGAVLFRRGDVNADGALNIADAIALLSHLFAGAQAPPCMSAADANDDGALNIADAIAVLSHLFAGTGDLPAPFAACGADPTPDALECLSFPPCQ